MASHDVASRTGDVQGEGLVLALLFLLDDGVLFDGHGLQLGVAILLDYLQVNISEDNLLISASRH